MVSVRVLVVLAFMPAGLRSAAAGASTPASEPAVSVEQRAVRVAEPPPSEVVSAGSAELGSRILLDDPSGVALDAFHRALERAARGTHRASVAVWGASHTACDHWVGGLRAGLQERFGDGGRGFTFPAWPNDFSYWQKGVRVDRGEGWEHVRLGRQRSAPDHYGIAGIAFDSGGRVARGRVRTARRGMGASVDRFTILHMGQPGGGAYEVRVDGALQATVSTEADAIVAGTHRLAVPAGPHELAIRTLPGAPVRLYGVDLGRGEGGVVVHNLGLGGSRARYHNKWREPVHGDHLRALAPDLLVFAYGGNEGNDFGEPMARFAGQFERALRRSQRLAPQASCLVVGPADKPLLRRGRWTHRGRTTAIARIERRIAHRRGCAYFDTIRFMGGPMSMLEWVAAEPPMAREDHVHFSARGYARLSEVLLEVLLPPGP